MAKFYKATGIEKQDTAVGLLRIIQPMRFLKRMGICEETRILPFTGDMLTQKVRWNDKTMISICNGSELLLTDMIWQDEDFLRILNLRKYIDTKWVIDMDDNMLAVTADNPAYRGVKDVWPKMMRSLSFADGITVSVPSLKKLYGPLNKHIYVNPNGIDFSWWDKLKVEKHKGIRIGWRGASGHTYDRELVLPAMRAITKDFPDTLFVVFCQFDPKFDFPYEWHPYVPYFGKETGKDTHDPDYPEVLAGLNIDLAVVPLVDSSYNRGKSNLAYLEFSSLKIPTVLSPVENQKNMKALYASTNHEWYDQLAKLVGDKSTRTGLGLAAYAFVKEHYDMEKLIYPFAEWAEHLPRRMDFDDPEALFAKPEH